MVDLKAVGEGSFLINADISLRRLLACVSSMVLQLLFLTLQPKRIPFHHLVTLPNTHVFFRSPNANVVLVDSSMQTKHTFIKNVYMTQKEAV